MHAGHNSGWSGDSQADYAQATTDLEVETIPELCHYLHQIDFIRSLKRYYRYTRRCKILGFEDFFVVKYEASKQGSLVEHFDAGNISFLIALSSRGEYDGGGTFFQLTNDNVHLEQGSILCFDAKLIHR